MTRYRRCNFPGIKATQQATPNVTSIPKYNAGNQIGRSQIRTNPNLPPPLMLNGLTDGHRLFIQSVNDMGLLIISDWISYAFSLLLYYLGFLTLENRPELAIWFLSIATILFVLGISLSIYNKKLGLSKFVVFDRDTGLVYFPKVKRWPQLTIPFEDIDCYTDHFIGKGGMHFYALFYPRRDVKGTKRYRREMMMVGLVNNEEQATQQWTYIHHFMDKTQNFPKEVELTNNMIQWFKDRNLTLNKLMQEYGEAIVAITDETDEFLWAGNSEKLDPNHKFKQYHKSVEACSDIA